MKTLAFDDAQLNLIAEGLGLLPYARVAPLFANINAQIVNGDHLANQAKQAAASNPLPEVVGIPE